jgi:hypothetical protein
MGYPDIITIEPANAALDSLDAGGGHPSKW